MTPLRPRMKAWSGLRVSVKVFDFFSCLVQTQSFYFTAERRGVKGDADDEEEDVEAYKGGRSSAKQGQVNKRSRAAPSDDSENAAEVRLCLFQYQ